MDWNTIHWPAGAPAWLIILLAVVFADSLRRRIPFIRERVSGGRAAILLSLRALLYVVILFFLSGPTILEEKNRALPPRVLVLVDTSASMSVKDESQNRSRLESAMGILLKRSDSVEVPGSAEGGGLLQRLSESYDVRVAGFDTVSNPLRREDMMNLEAAGPGSDSLRAIRLGVAGNDGGAGEPGENKQDRPAAILLLSDGGDTAGSSWPPEDVGRMPPVLTLGFGSSRRFRDISLHDVRAPRLAFEGKEVQLEVTLLVHGFVGKKLPIALTRDGRVVSTQTVDVRRDSSGKKVRFRFTPRDVGSQVLAVETPVQRGELVESNNRVEIPLEVRRNKIRILTISGAPTWNYRFLRMALKRDPSIDLVSFVFLRTSEDDPGVPTRQLSLVPFPVDTLFLEELKNFDIVIFDNFAANQYFSNYYLQRVNDYIRGGGGFLILGGKNSFSSGGYVLSPLERVLPVRLLRKDDFSARVRMTGKLTTAGSRHPIMRLSSDPRSNERLWSGFPALRQGNLTVAGEEGAVLLSSQAEGEFNGAPLIAVRRIGEGRVLSILTDDMWRWNYGMVADEKTNRLYLRLVAQMIRWLSGDPATSQVQILPEAVPGKDGSYVIRMQVRDVKFEPAAEARVRLSLRDPYGGLHQIPAVYRPETGEFEARFRPRGKGSYRAEVIALMGEKPLGHSIRTVAVGGEAGGAEWADVRPHWERLRVLSKKTGGVFLPAGEGEDKKRVFGDRVLEVLKGKVPPVLVEVRDVRLWSIPWVAFILILLPAGEWTLRRLWGLA